MSEPIARRMLGVFGALMAMAPLFASAHHSTAMFDQARTLTLQGVVKEFRWINPHAFIQVLVKGVDSREEEWSVEMSTPRYLAKSGWTPGTLKAGDVVNLVIQPMRDGTKLGAYVSGAGPPGAFVNEPPTSPASTQAIAPARPSCPAPRVEVTVVEPSASSDTRPVMLAGRTVFVRRDAIVTTDDIAEIDVAGDDADTFIRLKYKPQAAARLLAATTDHDGLNLAFVVDDDVWLAFTWRGAYGIGPDGTQVSIRNKLAEAQKLAASIRGCASEPAR